MDFFDVMTIFPKKKFLSQYSAFGYARRKYGGITVTIRQRYPGLYRKIPYQQGYSKTVKIGQESREVNILR